MITATQERILKALAKYKYLTASQLVELNICNFNTARQYVSALQKEKLVKKTIYSQPITNNQKTVNIRLEGLNFLDKDGVKLLKDKLKPDTIKYPKSYKLAFSNDYFHRIFMVSVCIAFDNWIEKNNKSGHFLIDYHNSETTIVVDEHLTVKPDIIVNFDSLFCIIEVWAGIEKEYIINQLANLTKAIASKKVSEFLDYPKAPRILNVFKDFNTLERVKSELKADNFFKYAVEKGLFYFITLDEIKQSFEKWQDINSNWVNITRF